MCIYIYIYLFIYIYTNIYIYIYTYTRTSRSFGPLVLLVAFSLHRGLPPLPLPKKFPDTPKYPEALKNFKKKINFFLKNF